MNWLALLSFALLCALPIAIGASLTLTFASGAEPWSKNRYKLIGFLDMGAAALFAALFVSLWGLDEDLIRWYMALPAVLFILIALAKLRKAYPRRQK